MNKIHDYDWDEVLSAAARLQGLVREAVLVGGTASALFAGHRTSYDADHVVPDLRGNFSQVLSDLESVAGWQTARTKAPVLILGNLDGIETGVRQLIRSEPLETTEMYAKGQKIVVPTEAEILRIKGALILKRNATRDYLDFAALSKHLGNEDSVEALHRFDDLYPQKNNSSALQQLYIQLADPRPYDLRGIDLSTYKNISEYWKKWENIVQQCNIVAVNIINHYPSEIKKQEMQIEKEYDERHSLGFVWRLPEEGLHILRADNAKDALFTFHKYRVEHVSKTLQTLERIPCTYAQTRTILDGKTVSGLTTRQLRAVENYGAACEALVDMLEQNSFGLTKESICNLHSLIGKDEAKHAGRFRDHQVLIEQSHYTPPKSDHLEGLFAEGVAFLSSLENVQERAICTFLFLARSQFFNDCNKRTASLVMNGILMQSGFQPLSIDSEHFLEKMATFYESADATEVISEINAIAKKQYRFEGLEQQTYSERREQKNLLDVTQSYSEQLKTLVEAKESQVLCLESRLEACVSRQQEALKRACAKRPNAVARLWRGKTWEETVKREQARLTTLEKRLSRVRGIRAAMGGKRLEELARKKLQRTDPALVSRHDAEERLHREHQADEPLRLAREKQQTQGRGRSLIRDC